MGPRFPPHLLPNGQGEVSPAYYVPLLFYSGSVNSDVLSRTRVSTLLGNSDRIGSRPATDIDNRDSVHPCSPGARQQIIHRHLRTLRVVGRHFTHRFHVKLFGLLHHDPSVAIKTVHVRPCRRFTHGLPIPAGLGLVRLGPLHNAKLIIFSPDLIFVTISGLFNNSKHFPAGIRNHRFARARRHIVGHVLGLTLRNCDST